MTGAEKLIAVVAGIGVLAACIGALYAIERIKSAIMYRLRHMVFRQLMHDEIVQSACENAREDIARVAQELAIKREQRLKEAQAWKGESCAP